MKVRRVNFVQYRSFLNPNARVCSAELCQTILKLHDMPAKVPISIWLYTWKKGELM